MTNRRPDASVVIPAYLARAEISGALRSLNEQTYQGSFEVIVVASGEDRCAEYVEREFPGVRVLHSPARIWPGAARNLGVEAARGEVIAFMPADAIATPDWIEARLAAHARGAELVAGAIEDGDPRHPVASAEYLLEYSALMPIAALLEEQSIPHALSFRRSVFCEVGTYPEDTTTGEDTIFNRRCLEAGFEVAFAPQAALRHHGNRSLRGLWRHAHAHGRGLAQCVDDHALPSGIGDMGQSLPSAAWRMLILYPAHALRAKTERLARFAPRLLPRFLILSPLILFGSVATGVGAFGEYRNRRKGGRQGPGGERQC